ncbi:hypothetical protein B0H14DRAFT_1245248 [Mycena olivaceomarginata]|nr:hypothetical protein B0H14DRAFT_1245248 [Mycena olivaceomarginata]
MRSRPPPPLTRLRTRAPRRPIPRRERAALAAGARVSEQVPARAAGVVQAAQRVPPCERAGGGESLRATTIQTTPTTQISQSSLDQRTSRHPSRHDCSVNSKGGTTTAAASQVHFSRRPPRLTIGAQRARHRPGRLPRPCLVRTRTPSYTHSWATSWGENSVCDGKATSNPLHPHHPSPAPPLLVPLSSAPCALRPRHLCALPSPAPLVCAPSSAPSLVPGGAGCAAVLLVAVLFLQLDQLCTLFLPGMRPQTASASTPPNRPRSGRSLRLPARLGGLDVDRPVHCQGVFLFLFFLVGVVRFLSRIS